jgi:hypothetical protein
VVADRPNAIGNRVSNVNAAAQAIAGRRKKPKKTRIAIIPAGLAAGRTIQNCLSSSKLIVVHRMFALRQKQTFAVQNCRSGLLLKADMPWNCLGGWILTKYVDSKLDVGASPIAAVFP